MNRLSCYSFLFLVLCLSAWGAFHYALTMLQSETRMMDEELTFLTEQEKNYRKTTPQRAVDDSRLQQLPSTLEKFKKLSVEYRKTAGRKQAVDDGAFQRYLDQILESAKEQEQRITRLQHIAKELEKEAKRLKPQN